MTIITCIWCGTLASKRFKTALFCSSSCGLKHWRANNPEHNRQIKRDWRRKNGITEFGSLEHRQKAAKQFHWKGAAHPNWKGDEVGYRALHYWVARELKKAGECRNCDRKVPTDWANLSGNYYRDLSDWVELCKKCHKRYDLRRLELCL